MKQRGIISKHQVLENGISEAYKAEIELTSMTYQLVLPDDHRRNMAVKSNPNVEEPLRQCHERRRRNLPTAPVVPSDSAS